MTTLTRRGATASLLGAAAAATLPARARAAEPLRMGLALSQSGNLADSGELFRRGVDLWREDVNKRGGLLGRQVELVVYDDRSDPATAARLYERLIANDNVDLLLALGFGLLRDRERGGRKHKRVFVNAGGASESIHMRGFKYVFQSAPAISAYVAGVVPTAKKFGFKTMAIVSRDYGAARDMTKVLDKIAPENDLKIVMSEYFPAGTTDYSSNIAKARQLDPDIWIGVGYPNEAIEMIRQFRAVNYLPKAFIHNGVAQDDFVKATGKDGEYAIAISLYEPELKTAGNAEFVAAHKAKYDGSSPGYYAAFSYQGSTVLERAVAKTGSFDQDKIRDTLTTFETDGVMGHHKVDPKTFVQIGLKGLLDQVRNGKREIIFPEDLKMADAVLPMPAWDKR